MPSSNLEPDISFVPVPVPVPMAPSSAPTAPAYGSPTFNPATLTLDSNQLNQLRQQGYTDGLARALVESCSSFPLRIWIIDNSGSMNSVDGNMLVATKSASEVKSISCTRWKEIQETVKYHAQMAALLKAPTTFRFLNHPGVSGLDQEFSIADKGEAMIEEDLRVANNIISHALPNGLTPLSDHVRAIREQVTMLAPSLREQGKRIAVILATDGLPSDDRGVSGPQELREFTAELRSLEGLPVWVVIRLCTDDREVVNFYNNLDDELELSMEVLDNFTDEAEEIYEKNPWINYSLPLHRMRELGFQHRIFDLLDERRLTVSELRDYCMLVFGAGSFDGVPEPETDFKGFLRALDRIMKKEKLQWHAVKKRMKPLLSLKKMSEMYSDGGCVIS